MTDIFGLRGAYEAPPSSDEEAVLQWEDDGGAPLRSTCIHGSSLMPHLCPYDCEIDDKITICTCCVICTEHCNEEI
jgi:hypothetical protein